MHRMPSMRRRRVATALCAVLITGLALPAAADLRYPANMTRPVMGKDAAGVERTEAPAASKARSRSAPAARDAATTAAPAGNLERLVEATAREHGVPVALARAVVTVESRWRPGVTGRAGEVGLMQIKHQTARGEGFSGSRAALYGPANNIEYGMRYLAGAYRKSGGSICGTVSKYQGGHGVRGVTRAGAVYCAKVKRLMGAARTASAGGAENAS